MDAFQRGRKDCEVQTLWGLLSKKRHHSSLQSFLDRRMATFFFILFVLASSSLHATEPYTIYGDATTWKVKALKGPVDLKHTAHVKNGSHSMFIDGSIVELTAPEPVSTSGYDRIEFWAHGGPQGTGAKRYDIVVDDNSATYDRQQRYLWISSGRWEKYSVPLSHLGNPSAISKIKILPDGWATQIYIDDLRLASGPHETFMQYPVFPEIIYDGGFEDGANGQYNMRAKVECVTEPVHSGKYALRVYERPTGKGFGWTGPDFEPTPFFHLAGPGWYEVSAWFRLPTGAGRKAKCVVSTEIIDSDPVDAKHGKSEMVGKTRAEVGEEWTEVKFQTKVETGKVLRVFKALPVADEETTEYFVDDVSIRKIPAPDGSDDGSAKPTIPHVAVQAEKKELADVFTVESFGKKGSGEGEFLFPRGVACDKNGNLIVADSDNHRIQIRQGGSWKIFGKKGVGNGEFSYPRGVAAGEGDDFFVVDRGNHRIVKIEGGNASTFFDAGAFDYTAATGKNLEKPLDPLCIEAIAYSPQWGLVATDVWRCRVSSKKDASSDWVSLVKSEDSGRSGGVILTIGRSEGMVDMPQGVSVDAKGNLFVADMGNHRVQMRASDGKWTVLAGISPASTKCHAPEFLGASSDPGKFDRPKAVAADSQGNLFVLDSGNHRLQVRDAKSGVWTAFGKQGEGAGEFDGPESIAIDASDNIYIADTRNHRIVKLNRKK